MTRAASRRTPVVRHSRSPRELLGRLGFVASVLSDGISASRTCRLRNASPAKLRELIGRNLEALEQIATFLAHHRILLYRISSNVIPFASHPINQIDWWSEFAPRLERLGSRFVELGVRLSTHPGQYTVLNSPKPEVARAAIAELEYHVRLLEALGTDDSAKIILHVGGLYGASERVALDRFAAAASQLPARVRRRLAVENDDRLFDAAEVLSLATRIGVPVVFDWLHHQANPCRAPLAEVLPAIFATWTRADGRPKVHLSSQAENRPRGAHAAFVNVSDALDLFDVLPPQPFDCMLEAKEKDRALLRLRGELAAAGIVEWDLQPSRG